MADNCIIGAVRWIAVKTFANLLKAALLFRDVVNNSDPTVYKRSIQAENWQRQKEPQFLTQYRLWDIAQLVARLVRNEKVRGSNPLISTKAASAAAGLGFENGRMSLRQGTFYGVTRVSP
jgi:hypothetical protein